MKNTLFLLMLLAGSYLQAQKIDSVLYNGSYYYVYPYGQKVSSASILDELVYKDVYKQFQIEAEGKAAKPDKTKMKLVRENSDRFFQTNYNLENDIIPALHKLPNGKYIQYFDGYFTLGKKDEMIPNKTRVAGFFELKDNLLEGKAIWMNVIGDTVKQGEFVHGAKEGSWTLRSFYHDRYYSKLSLKNFLRKKEVYRVFRANYKQGVLNGPSELEIDGVLYNKGHYKDGKESGEWFTYNSTILNIGDRYVDTLLIKTHYILAAKEIISHKPYIRTVMDFNYPYKYYTFSNYYESPDVDFGSFWRLAGEENDLELPEENINAYEGENFDMYNEEMLYFEGYYMNGDKVITKGKLIDSLGLINTYELYEEYYDNGQLKIKLEYANGDLVNEDTLFWDNGQPADVVLYHADSKTYENRKLDYKGELYEVIIYDSLGNFKKQELDPFYRDKHIAIEGLDASAASMGYGNYYYYSPDNSVEKNDKYYVHGSYFRYENPDTLSYQYPKGKMIIEKTWYDDTTNWSSLVYDADTRTLTEEIKSMNHQPLKSTVYEFDEDFRSVRGKSVYRLQDLSLVSTFNGNYPADYINIADTFPAMFATSYYSWFQLTKDPVLQYKNEPFTGKVSLHINTSKTSFSIKKNQVSIQISSNEKFLNNLEKDFVNYRKTGKTKYNDVLSVSQLMLNYQPLMSEMFPVVNSALSNNYMRYEAGYDPYIDQQSSLEGARIEGNYLNGKPNGTWKIYNAKGKLMISCDFINGELNGKRKEYQFASSKSRTAMIYGENHPILIYGNFPKKTTYFLAQESEYKNGLLTGNLYTYDWQGKITSKVPYADGYKSGVSFEHSPLLSTYLTYQDDEIDGIAKSYLHIPQQDSILLYELNFQHGLLQGESKSYHTNGKISQRGFFLNGMPIDDYEGYDSLGTRFHYVKFQYSFPVEEKIWEANQLSVRYQFDWRDSIFFRPEGLSESSTVNDLLYSYNLLGDAYDQPYYGRPSLVEKTGIEYRMTKYFPNDTVSRDGMITSGKKTGCWQFFSYDGEKLYEVEYYDTLIKINDSIQFKSKGLLTDFDAKGKLLSKSFIIEKFEKYDCSHTDHYEIRQFYTVWQAHDSLHRINGYVKNYYDNGTLQSEGNMKNGLPTGIWKIYDPFGKLNQVGEYVMGKRDGRWLSGDLSKTKYLGDICMNPNLPDLEAQIKYQEKLLDIYIQYFKTGKLLNSEYYGLDLNEYEPEETVEEPEY